MAAYYSTCPVVQLSSIYLPWMLVSTSPSLSTGFWNRTQHWFLALAWVYWALVVVLVLGFGLAMVYQALAMVVLVVGNFGEMFLCVSDTSGMVLYINGAIANSANNRGSSKIEMGTSFKQIRKLVQEQWVSKSLA